MSSLSLNLWKILFFFKVNCIIVFLSSWKRRGKSLGKALLRERLSRVSYIRINLPRFLLGFFKRLSTSERSSSFSSSSSSSSKEEAKEEYRVDQVKFSAWDLRKSLQTRRSSSSLPAVSDSNQRPVCESINARFSMIGLLGIAFQKNARVNFPTQSVSSSVFFNRSGLTDFSF